MKILSVVGNRPQFIKSGPVSAALREAGVEEVGLHTGQHWDHDLSEVFYEELGLPEPRYSLDLHTADAETMRPQIAAVLADERPDWTLVYGDTNSTLAGTEAAGDGDVPVAHVEAGLLLGEGVPGRIDVVGDVMADAAFRLAPIARERSTVLRRHELEPGGYVAATIHREANVRPERLARIVDGLGRLDERVIFPAHPRTRSVLGEIPPNVEVLSPLGYLDMAALVSQARVLVTDSGGLQKEAYWYGVPCVTARPSTEWVDTVQFGANVLVDDDPEKLAAAVASARMPDDLPSLYGDGHAAERIAQVLV